MFRCICGFEWESKSRDLIYSWIMIQGTCPECKIKTWDVNGKPINRKQIMGGKNVE